MPPRLIGAGLTLAALLLFGQSALAAPSVPALDSPTATRSTSFVVSARADNAACMIAEIDGVAQPMAREGASNRFSATLSISPSQGAHRLTLTAWDGAGCDGTNSRSSVDITYDTVAPEPFAWTTPALACPDIAGSCFLVKPGAVTLAWSRSSGASAYSVRVGGSEIARVSRTEVTLDSAVLPVSAPIDVVASDAAGNETSVTPARRIYVDRIAPRVRWLLPKATWVRGRLTLQVNASDPQTGIAGVAFTRSQLTSARTTKIGGLTAAEQPKVSFNTKEVPDGRYEFIATATDRAGNQTALKRVVRIDNAPPRFTGRARGLTTFTASAGRDRRVSVALSDTQSPWLYVSTTIRRGKKVVSRSLRKKRPDGGHQKLSIPALARGNYSIQTRFEDMAGNSVARTFSLRVR